MVDNTITYLETLRDQPVWQPITEEIVARFKVAARENRRALKQPTSFNINRRKNFPRRILNRFRNLILKSKHGVYYVQYAKTQCCNV